METLGQKNFVSVLIAITGGLVDLKNGIGLDWWIHVTEGKLISWNLDKLSLNQNASNKIMFLLQFKYKIKHKV